MKLIQSFESFIGFSDNFKKAFNKVINDEKLDISLREIENSDLDVSYFYVSYVDDKYLDIFTIKQASDFFNKRVGEILNRKYVYDFTPNEIRGDLYIVSSNYEDNLVTVTVKNDDGEETEAIINGFDLGVFGVKPNKVKIGRGIQEILSSSGYITDNKLLTKISDIFKFSVINADDTRIEILKGKKVFDGYDSNKIHNSSSLGESCMIDAFHDVNNPPTDLVALYDNKTNLIIARAYLWEISNESKYVNYKYVMDRVYMSNEMARLKLEDYCREHNYLYRTKDLTKWEIKDLNTNTVIDKDEIIVKGNIEISHTGFKSLYLDTFKYFNPKLNTLSINKRDYYIRYYSEKVLGLDIIKEKNIINIKRVDSNSSVYMIDNENCYVAYNKEKKNITNITNNINKLINKPSVSIEKKDEYTLAKVYKKDIPSDKVMQLKSVLQDIFNIIENDDEYIDYIEGKNLDSDVKDFFISLLNDNKIYKLSKMGTDRLYYNHESKICFYYILKL